jgi:hypothetical protein
MRHTLTDQDILPMDVFLKVRPEKAQEILAHKQHRRVCVGSHISFYFESYETIWWQIHEMLRVEKGGNEQVHHEIEAYTPLIPKTFPDGSKEFVATMMVEIENIPLRNKMLQDLCGIENHIFLRFGNFRIQAIAEKDVERTLNGKTSSVHFVRFHLNSKQVADFQKTGADVILEITHPHYEYKNLLSELTRKSLMD